MKSTKDFRNGKSASFGSDELRRGTKLAPARKNGKERFSIYDDVDDEEQLFTAAKRESAFDYLDDEEEA